MSGQKCDHAGWGSYANETGPCPEPTEMVEHCPHQKECPKCGHHVYMSCTCDGARAVNYATAILGAHYEKRG